MRLSRLVLVAALSLTTTGCSTFSTVQGWFGSDGEDLTAPVELEQINAQVEVRKRWSTSIGDGQGAGFFRINPVLVDDVLYVASSEGEVAAIDASDGDKRWSVSLERPLSGGVGFHGGSLYLGGADGSVLQLSANDGSLMWEAAVSGEVLAAPTVSDDWGNSSDIRRQTARISGRC